MKTLQLDKFQRYFEEVSGRPLHICFDDLEIDVDGVHVFLEGVPLLKDEETGDIYFPDRTKQIIAYFVEESHKKGEKSATIHRREEHAPRYSYATKFDLLYSDVDYEYIPGLTRPWDEGYLTPVFFNLSVLNKYTQHPDYRLDLFSTTYGTIWCGDQWTIDFGINRNKRVIMWLGDIAGLPEPEIYYLRSENIESDHDIHSQFYDAQIEVEFAESSSQQKAILKRRALNEIVRNKFGWSLFHLEGEVDSIIANLNRPVFWQDKHVGPAIESLNKIFVESVNVKALKKDIEKVQPESDVRSLGSLKSLELWLSARLGLSNAAALMCPLFVLYDFRILTCHLIPDKDRSKTLSAINTRLELPKENTVNELIYDGLVSKLLSSIEGIKNGVECQQSPAGDVLKAAPEE
jgi:hypothetical protein